MTLPSSLTRGQMAFVLVAVFAVFVFVRLGLWQLDRHAEKRDAAAEREARTAEPAIPLADLLRDVSSESADGLPPKLEWRRVTMSGEWEYGAEVLIRTRGMQGQPGVHVVTPLRVDPALPAVLVLRGWLPAPDAIEPATIDTSDVGIEPSQGRIGVVRASRAGAGEPVVSAGEGAERRPTFAAVDVGAIALARGLEAAPFFVQLLPAARAGDDRATRNGYAPSPDGDVPGRTAGTPVPVPMPPADSGPHMAYAIQWFAFALIAIVGTAAWLRHQRRRPRTPAAGGDARPTA